jgi:hypothetical protein
MIKILIEVNRGAALKFKVTVQAESIEGALKSAKRYNPGKDCKVVFPIDPEVYFVGGDLGRGGWEVPALATANNVSNDER